MKSSLQIQLIRNATIFLRYNSILFLIDPYFAPKHSLPPYADKSKNPLVDLPFSTEHIIRHFDAIIVSHLHTDHFDSVAKELLPKDLPLFCQPDNDDAIRDAGFTDVRVITDKTTWNNIIITRTEGQHGEGETAKIMGTVSGFVFEAENQPTVYWTGDTIWYPPIEQVIKEKNPKVIVTHSCGATWKGSAPIVMDAQQTVEVCRAAPDSIVVAVHMEALDHATVSREELRRVANEAGISEHQLIIPEDGAPVFTHA